jgi:hypothetical protein
MNYPFIEGISDIEETNAPGESRTTLILSSQGHSFQSCAQLSNSNMSASKNDELLDRNI